MNFLRMKSFFDICRNNIQSNRGVSVLGGGSGDFEIYAGFEISEVVYQFKNSIREAPIFT